MTVYGLTGGIACGKSTLGEMMREEGWTIVDSDAIAHRLMEPGRENWKIVVDAFGQKILNSDHTINRRALGDLVFSQSSLRQQLNALTHPAIRAVWQAEKTRFLQSQSTHPMVVIIPLLMECSLQQEFDRVLCIACSPARQLERMLQRGLTAGQVRQRVESQWPTQEKMNRSHLVFWNEGSLSALRRQLSRLTSGR